MFFLSDYLKILYDRYDMIVFLSHMQMIHIMIVTEFTLHKVPHEDYYDYNTGKVMQVMYLSCLDF